MICDVHAHYLPRRFSDYMGERYWPPVGKPTRTGLACHPFSDLPEDISGRFDLMDAAGVGRQVLSPHWPPYLPDEAQGVHAIKLLNDGYAELAHQHPDRLSSYVMLPLPHIDASLKEMARGFDQLGCVGVNMNIVCLGDSIGHEKFEPIYAEMNRRNAILFVHPAGSGIQSPMINDWNYRASVGTSMEDAVFVLHMIARQIPHRYPNIKFIVPHLGGPIPMLLHRLDQQGQRDQPNLAEAPSVTAKKFYYDTVCYGSKAGFCCALEAFGDDHLVTGSDYPVLQDYESYTETFAYIERLGLPKSVTDKVLHHNAQKLFGFDH
ncbi:MAG TPA: amidohydrolase family protein [Stellaceae bacterium]|jgi:predicted TIM-barrel fold metal-dependent hydrolase|nr:amidohydrolase family protein [Stellaceae bacterium]